MSGNTSDQLTVKDARRSLRFDVSTSLEDQDTTKGIEECAQISVERIPAEAQLRNDCENLWQELNSTHTRLDAGSTNNNTSRLDEEEFDASRVLERVLKVKEKKLQTELLALENQGLQVTSTNPEYTKTHLKSQLLTSVRQLEETLSVVKGQRKEVEDELRREEEIVKQHREVSNALRIKIDSLEQEKENVKEVTSQIKDLERQKKAADVYLIQTMKKLGSFLSSNFPLPSAADMKGNKNLARAPLNPDIRYISLQQLTEDLMNMSYSRPHDPYLRIKDAHWPPYIELLLRCGIAQRHPQDCNLIRLVAFNR
ncbi:centromere protein K-like isoform X2 [Orbicella faveolata]|nr:centromere protein K-like isoform X2 [Orbicella faveolata]XP_020602089.1 centromere protein K-like isoform X2 [Orbicella faveolata]